jgi:hypothetical protein
MRLLGVIFLVGILFLSTLHPLLAAREDGGEEKKEGEAAEGKEAKEGGKEAKEGEEKADKKGKKDHHKGDAAAAAAAAGATGVATGVKTVTDPTVELPIQLQRAEDLLAKMTTELGNTKSWAKSVHDLIQNYQFKYTKSLVDIKAQEKKIERLRKLVSVIKKANLRNVFQQSLSKATAELDELSVRDGAKSKYEPVVDKIAALRKDLSKLHDEKVDKVAKHAADEIDDAVATTIPPNSNDALKAMLTNADGSTNKQPDGAVKKEKGKKKDGKTKKGGKAAPAAPAAPAKK